MKKKNMTDLFMVWISDYLKRLAPVPVLDNKGNPIGQWMVVRLEVATPDEQNLAVELIFADSSKLSLKYKIN